jgi:Lrp/AsnC family transcriptional regulator, leucine-responsive regulatory protein
MTNLDAIDLQILDLVQHDGRLTYSEVGAAVGLSISAVNERLRKLNASGAIQRVVGLVNPDAVGMSLAAFIQILLERPEHDAPFLDGIRSLTEVQECHHIAGDYSYLLKVRTRNTAHLEELISQRIKRLPGVTRSQTTIVLSTPKESTFLPIVAKDS